MKYEIDIDLGTLADEWEPVAFRQPTEGEWWFTKSGVLTGGVSSVPITDGPRLIVRRLWKWPEWLTAEWIAMDEVGAWFGYDMEPSDGRSAWSSNGSSLCNLKLTAFAPPPCTDWRQSKRRNPHAKAAT